MVGESTARVLTESTLSEAIGGLVDARLSNSPSTAASEPPPSYSEIAEFFQRFAPEVVLPLSAGSGTTLDLVRMIEIRDSVCSRIVSELPVTLGAYGRGILAVDWRAIVKDLPVRTDALRRLATLPVGKQIQSSLSAELDDLLSRIATDLPSADAWLRVRFEALERLRRLPPAGGTSSP